MAPILTVLEIQFHLYKWHPYEYNHRGESQLTLCWLPVIWDFDVHPGITRKQRLINSQNLAGETEQEIQMSEEQAN